MKGIKTSQEKPRPERHYGASENVCCLLSSYYAFLHGPENKPRKSQACSRKSCLEKSQHTVSQSDVFSRGAPQFVQATNNASMPNRLIATFLPGPENLSKELTRLAVSGRAKNPQPIDFKLFAFSTASVKSGEDIQRNVVIHLLLPL